jgi:enoyl-CoA hydratase
MYSTLLAETEKGICTLTINRPDKLNALNKTVFDELDAFLKDVYENPEIRAVIITGAGSKSFVAGADIQEFQELSAEDGKKMAKRGQDIFFRIEQSPKPMVAAVNGFALGGGCELAMACHFRIASVKAKFGQPEVNLGLIPGYGGTQRMVQLIGKGRALELLMTARMITAAEAKEYGLVNDVTEPDQLIPRTKEILAEILSKAPLALTSCIKAANAVHDNQANGYEVEIREFGKCFETEDVKEGTAAFLEKRKAAFTGN